MRKLESNTRPQRAQNDPAAVAIACEEHNSFKAEAHVRKASSLALELIRDASHTPGSLRCERAWKLLLFIRILPWRPAGVIRVPKADLLARFQSFFRGAWELLLNRAREEASAAGQPAGAISSPPTAAQRAERAVKLAHPGELSSARQALLAEPLAPATETRSLQEELQPGEEVFAFLDDTYIAASPDRATYLCRRLEHHLSLMRGCN